MAAILLHTYLSRYLVSQQLSLLQQYETSRYKLAVYPIHIEDDRGIIEEKLVFVEAGDPKASSELKDRELSLGRYQLLSTSSQ